MGNKLGNSLGQVSLNLEYFIIQPNFFLGWKFFNPTQLIVTLKSNPTQLIGIELIELNYQVGMIFQFSQNWALKNQNKLN